MKKYISWEKMANKLTTMTRIPDTENGLLGHYTLFLLLIIIINTMSQVIIEFYFSESNSVT